MNWNLYPPEDELQDSQEHSLVVAECINFLKIPFLHFQMGLFIVPNLGLL